MKPDEDDPLFIPSVFDAADRDEDEQGVEDREADPGGMLMGDGRSPRSIRDWMGRLDWPGLLPAVVAAERALSELALRWRQSPERDAIVRTWLIDEAVGRARMQGYVTTRQRVIERLLLLEAEDPDALERYIPILRIAPGDGVAVREILEMREGWTDPARKLPERVCALAGGGADADGVAAWLSETGDGAGDQPATVFAAAALWSLAAHHARCVQDPVAAGLSVAPALLQGRRARGQPPLGLARAFMDRPVRWSPHADPGVWMARFADGVSRSARVAMAELARLEARVEQVREVCADRRSSSRLADVGALAAREELMTVRRIRRHLGWDISDRGVRKILWSLQEAGCVHEITGRQRFRVYAHASVGRSDLVVGGAGDRLGPGRGRKQTSLPSPAPGRDAAAGGDIDLDALIRDAERASNRLSALRRDAMMSGVDDGDSHDD